MKSSIKLFRIAGIDIGVHYSWFFILLFFTWTLAVGYFPAQYPLWSTTADWVAGAIAALMIFVSVVIHELMHSIVARAKGIPVSSITLFILGGVSNLEEEPRKPGAEFIMAIVGPASSLVLALIFWGIAKAAGTANANNAVVGVIAYLGVINLYLGVFNLLPGFPLDGGRVLRSIIWGATNNLTRATNIATTIGQIFGWLFIATGIYFILLIPGGFVSGIWLAIIGWFLTSAADASRKEVTMRERLSKIKVRELMKMNVTTISPDTTVQDMVSGIFRQQHDRAVPVCQAGQLMGIATIEDIKKVSQEKWPTTPVKNIMTSQNLYTVTPEDNVNTAMQLIAKHDINQVLIKDEGKCAGLLTRADIIRYLQMSQELGLPVNRKGSSQT